MENLTDNSENLMTLFVPKEQNIVFHDLTTGNEIGRLTWDDKTMTFTGNADASAKLFFDNLIKRHAK